MDGLPTRLIFTVGSRAFSWGDVGAAARRWGTWRAAERRTREGIACVRHAEQIGDPISDAEMDRAAAAFRYDRGLLSADELGAWLARWRLSQPYWMEYVRRSLLRERWATELPALLTRHPMTEDEVDDFVITDLVCSGDLERDALRLAEHTAVGAAVAGDPGAELEELERWFGEFRERAASAQAIEREVHAQHVDWLRLECRWLAHTEEDVVREAALCVREDERDLEQVAREAGADTGVAQTYLESTEPGLRAQLLGARRGDVLGPLAVGGGFQLIEVLDKRAPTAEDPEIRERAIQAIVRRAVEGEVVNRVQWHERLEG